MVGRDLGRAAAIAHNQRRQHERGELGGRRRAGSAGRIRAGGRIAIQTHRAQQHVDGNPERIDEAPDRRPVAVLVPRPAPHAVIDRDRHLVLVGRARLNRGGLDDANLARRRARRVDVRLPDLRRPLAEREVIGGRIRRVVAEDVAQPHARLVLRDVQVAVDLEALPGVAIDHRRHHVSVAVRVRDDHRRRESAERAGAEDAERVGVGRFIAVSHHQRVGHERKERIAAAVAPDLRQRQAPDRVRDDRRRGDGVAAEAEEAGGIVLDDDALRVGLLPAEVGSHAVHLAAVRRFEVVVAARGIAARRRHRRGAAPLVAHGQFTPSL